MDIKKLEYISTLPDPPYYAVIFTSYKAEYDEGYSKTAQHMLELAALQPGYLGVDSARENSTGITVSYWRDEASIHQWKQQLEHQQAQQLGRTQWYEEYSVRIAKVERSYSFRRGL